MKSVKKAIIFYILLILLIDISIAGEQEIKQHMTEISRDSIARINAHTDEKMDELESKGNEMINRANQEIETATRNASIKIFIALASAIVLGGSIVLLMINMMWKRYTEILPLANLDEKRATARLWALKSRSLGFGLRKIKKEMKKSGYSKKDIEIIIEEIK